MELINLSCVRLWMRDCVLMNWQFKTKKKNPIPSTGLQ